MAVAFSLHVRYGPRQGHGAPSTGPSRDAAFRYHAGPPWPTCPCLRLVSLLLGGLHAACFNMLGSHLLVEATRVEQLALKTKKKEETAKKKAGKASKDKAKAKAARQARVG